MVGLARRLRSGGLGKPVAETPTRTSEFGSFAPDAPALADALSVANNVFAREDGSYNPFQKPQPISETPLDSRVSGAISMVDRSGQAWTYAGTDTKLYESSDYNYVDVSKIGDYTVGSEDYWEFEQFRDLVIATHIDDPVQSKTVGDTGADFADLIVSTNKPSARHIATVGNFLVLGNTRDSVDGDRPKRIWWSAFGDASNFDPDAVTQSDFEDLVNGGHVQRVIGGQEYGVIMQTNMIRRMSYVGPPAIFSFTPVDRTRGTPIPRSVAYRGRRIGYIAEEGFMMFDGLESQAIGDGTVDRTFWSSFDINQKTGVAAAIDPEEKLLIWAYPANGGDQGRANRLVVYNWVSRKWSTVDVKVEHIFNAFTLGINVDTVDSRLNNIDTSVWAQESLDSSLFKGGQISFSAFDYDHVQNLLTGPNLAMTMETKDVAMVPGLRAWVDKVRPIIEGPATVTIGFRDDLSNAVEYSQPIEKNGQEMSFFGGQATNGRYHRIRVQNAEGTQWNRALGYQAYARNSGVYNG